MANPSRRIPNGIRVLPDEPVLRIDISEVMKDMHNQEPEVMHAAGTLLSWIAKGGLNPRDRMTVVAWVAALLAGTDSACIEAAESLAAFLTNAEREMTGGDRT